MVDTTSLKKTIKNGKTQATVLDVWENEPDIDTELLTMVDIGTPHIAGYSYDGKVAGMIMIYEALCKHFGFKPEHTIDDFLPEPEVPEIKVQPEGYAEQEILKAAVEEIYKIRQDDKRLREILNMPLGKRCATFDRLRREYPIRSEFQNTTVIFSDRHSDVAEKLRGIGFKVKNVDE